MAFLIDDRRLVDSHQSGDPDAFASIVRAHAKPLLSRARRRLNDEQAAEDAVQETFLRAYRALPRFGSGTDCRLTPWLYRILDNVCVDEALKRRRNADLVTRVGSLGTADEPAADAIVEAVPDADLVGAVATLPDAYRQALFLREVEGLSYSDLAEQAGISEVNARARVSRARTVLRRLVGPVVSGGASVVAIFRRADRVLVDAGQQTAAVASVHMPMTSQLVAYATPANVDGIRSTARVAAAAVVIVAVPLGSMATAVVRRDPPPPEPKFELTLPGPTPEAVQKVERAPEAVVSADPLPEDDGPPPEPKDGLLVPGTVDGVTLLVPGLVVTEDDATKKAEEDKKEEPVAEGDDVPADEPAEESADPEPADPAPLSALDAAVAVAERGDGRFELEGDGPLHQGDEWKPGRLALLVTLPREGDDGKVEYRLSGSFIADDGSKIRLTGSLVSFEYNEFGRVARLDGTYASTSPDLPSKGKFSLVFDEPDEGQATVAIRFDDSIGAEDPPPSGSTD